MDADDLSLWQFTSLSTSVANSLACWAVQCFTARCSVLITWNMQALYMSNLIIIKLEHS